MSRRKPGSSHFALSPEKKLIFTDIEKMYVQVSVRPQNRKLFRFLWGTEDPETYEVVRHVFGAENLSICANHVLQTCYNDRASYYPSVLRLVHENVYMDDFYYSTDIISEAIHHMEHLRCVLLKVGFNLTNGFQPISPADTPNTKKRILGIPWSS